MFLIIVILTIALQRYPCLAGFFVQPEGDGNVATVDGALL